MNTSIEQKILSAFPDFKKSNEFLSKMMETASIVEVPAGAAILDVGNYIKSIPFLLDGLVKIYREDAEGNEILLYYINSGESCIVSITTSIKDETSSVKAIVEEDSTLLVLGKDDFVSLLSEFNLLHTFTYDLFTTKYNELINSIDNLAFSDNKTRLYNYLKQEAEVKGTDTVSGLTHKKIAVDLATSREVVSRLLYSLQKEGKVSMANKQIKIN